MRIGYFLSSEEHGPRELVEQARLAAGGRLRPPVDLRPLPPLDRRPGPEPVRLVGDRRARRAAPGMQVDHRRHLPDGPHPPGDRRPGRGDHRGAARGPLRARRRHRRGAQRAHPRRPLARGRRAARDARGGRRGHARPVGRRARSATTARHYTVENARLYTLPDAPPADARLRVRAEGDRPRGADRRRLRAPSIPTPTLSTLPRRRRRGGPARRARRSAGARTSDECVRDRAPPVAQRGARRRALAGAPHARALRAGVRAGHRGR